MCSNTDNSNSKSSPKDGTKIHSWILESPTPNSNTSSLTTDGVLNIAAHKYVPGHYTALDTLLNPTWTYLTELLPMWLAPNMVTTFGGLHCALAYAFLWHYSPNFDLPVPDWVLLFAGYCTIAYYTLDCMDGKQARRTGTSSPLGQLFDHGFDCVCTMSHCAAVGGMTMVGGTVWFFVLQSQLQFSFFMAQWEEYYTHKLPHAMGNVGVTEVNYALGVFTMLNAFIDRDLVWNLRLVDLFPSAEVLPVTVAQLKMSHIGLIMALLGNVILVSGSFHRVMTDENVIRNRLHLSAISKLWTPILISMGPFLLPSHTIETGTRLISMSMGFLYCYLTVKLICFSMAKMTYATFQLDSIPFVLGYAWIRLDGNLTERGGRVVLAVLCCWYGYKLFHWAGCAIDQICEQLDIYCFTIKKKRSDGSGKKQD